MTVLGTACGTNPNSALNVCLFGVSSIFLPGAANTTYVIRNVYGGQEGTFYVRTRATNNDESNDVTADFQFLDLQPQESTDRLHAAPIAWESGTHRDGHIGSTGDGEACGQMSPNGLETEEVAGRRTWRL